ncbi:hypothetical protein MW887_001967 [Aspergillus wentii]|nr:hypothetical protein MW887_001967 [Aspergillus wentii]
MSSGFVSGGTSDKPIERDDEWRRVQQELEEERKRKADLGKQDGGKSLYEVLEQNKMVKQEAFEEKMKLKNQFRSLDEDEVDFLDSVLESTRAQEAAVKKDTADQLEEFRRQREEAEKVLLEDTSADVKPSAETEDWKIPARKRRRDKKQDLLLPGKKRKSLAEEEKADEASSQTKQKTAQATKPAAKSAGGTFVSIPTPKATPQESNSSQSPKNAGKQVESADAKASQPEAKPAAQPSSFSLGLAGYSSDSE